MNREKLLLIIFHLSREYRPLDMDTLIREAPFFFPGENNVEAVQRASYRALISELTSEGFLNDDLDDIRLRMERWQDFVRLRWEFAFKTGYGLEELSQSQHQRRQSEREAGIMSLTDEAQRTHAAKLISGFPEPVLDLGCGTGELTMILGTMSGRSIIGMDSADDAIAQAREQHGEMFFVHDMKDLYRFDRPFKSLLALDSLYFQEDLQTMLQDMHQEVGPGKSLVFYSQFQPPEQDATRTSADSPQDPEWKRIPAAECEPGRILSAMGIPWEAEDFTENDRQVWTTKRRIVEDLIFSYREERCLLLYYDALSETRSICALYERGSCGRYAFHF